MTTTTQNPFAVSALHYWELTIRRANDLFDKCSDEDMLQPIVPGKNRVIYVLGHLLAVHDRMLALLDISPRQHTELDPLFITSPDNAEANYPSAQELRQYWHSINQQLTAAFQSWTPEEWLSRHTAVSPEDFAKEPHRNRFSMVINRAGHVQYHLGQLVWAKK